MKSFEGFDLDDEIWEMLRAAREMISDLGMSWNEDLALLYIMVDSRRSLLRRLLVKLDVELDEFEVSVRNHVKEGRRLLGYEGTQTLSGFLKEAYSEIFEEGREMIKENDLLKVLLNSKSIQFELTESGASATNLQKLLTEERPKNSNFDFTTLQGFGTDLTELARKGKLDPCIGRETEIQTMMRVLSKRRKSNVVLVGEPGVGKSALVEGLAQRIVKGQAPPALNCKIFSLDLTALLAETSNRGDLEKRVKEMLAEVKNSDAQVILFIDELHMAMKTLANMLKPMLARGEIKCIGATTSSEYREHMEEDGAFNRRFYKLLVEETSVETSIDVMRHLRSRYEVHHGVRIEEAALVEAVRLTKRYMTASFLPDKALDVLDEACAMVSLSQTPGALEGDITCTKKKIASLSISAWNHEEEIRSLGVRLNNLKLDKEAMLLDIAHTDIKTKETARTRRKLGVGRGKWSQAFQDDMSRARNVVGADQIAQMVSRKTGIPVDKLNQDQAKDLLDLGKRLSKRVVGQAQAVESVANSIIKARSGLSRPRQPIGAFLFLGPTGVGKTELAKALAAEMFHDEANITRIDMAEYQEKHTISRLIGSPPGYIGHNAGGQLTEAVRNKPNQIILLDEIEKAHSKVISMFLGVLDDARLTDGKGRCVDFSNTVIIMTSNIGHKHILESNESRVMGEVKSFFSPEFLNRLDASIIFNKLNLRNLREIANIQLNTINSRLDPKLAQVTYTPAFMSHLLSQFISSPYGARPLCRYLESNIITNLSKLLLSNSLPKSSCVQADFDSNTGKVNLIIQT